MSEEEKGSSDWTAKDGAGRPTGMTQLIHVIQDLNGSTFVLTCLVKQEKGSDDLESHNPRKGV